MPASWFEYVPNPSPTDVCVLCNEYRLTHDDFACARFTSDDELCPRCEGAGVLGDVRRADYDGRKCQACAGQGYVESGRDEAARQEVEAEMAIEAGQDDR